MLIVPVFLTVVKEQYYIIKTDNHIHICYFSLIDFIRDVRIVISALWMFVPENMRFVSQSRL